MGIAPSQPIQRKPLIQRIQTGIGELIVDQNSVDPLGDAVRNIGLLTQGFKEAKPQLPLKESTNTARRK